MFSKGPTGILSGGGEDFACPSVRKIGRSLSQTSFLFTSNFIHIPQSFELIDQKKTLAFAPSFKWHHSSNEDCSEQTSVNYESSQNNFSLTSSAPSKSNQNLLFVTENESQLSQVNLPSDESRTDLSSSYKYNPIFPENQLYDDDFKGKTSCPASYTSVKHHILENIPINLLSNLNIFLNENKYESLISSKSSFSPTNDAPPKNNQQSPTLSGSNVDLKYQHVSRQEVESWKCFLSRSRTLHRSNNFSNASTHLINCQQNDLIVLKPASDSVLASCSSESLISDIPVERRPSSETTSASESVNSADGSDMRVHYINGSAADESEYSLLISQGYTFASKLKSKRDLKYLNNLTDGTGDSFTATSDCAGNNVAEMELRVINFSEYNVDPFNANPHQNGSSTSRERSSNLEQEVFQSCNSEIKSSVASNHLNSWSPQRRQIVSNKQYVDGAASSARSIENESEILRSNNEVRCREKAAIITSKDKNFALKNEIALERKDTLLASLSDEVLCNQQKTSLRNTVEKISDRFLRLENRHTSDGESSSETYTEPSRKIKNKSDEDDRDSGSEGSYSDESDRSDYNSGHRCKEVKNDEYSCVEEYQYLKLQRLQSKHFRRGKHSLKSTDLSSSQSYASKFKLKPANKITRNIADKARVEVERRKRNMRKNCPAVSKSRLVLRRRFSRCTVTSDSTYSNAHKRHVFLKRGKIKRAAMEECRGNTVDKKMFVNKIVKQPNIRGRKRFRGENLEVQLDGYKNKEPSSSFKAEDIDRLRKKKENAKICDRKKIDCIDSRQEVLNFIGRRIINLDKQRELRSYNDRITSSCRDKQDSPYDKHGKVFVFNQKGAEPEMDVYSRKKKKEADTKNKPELTEKISNQSEAKNVHSFNQKKQPSFDEMKLHGKMKEKPSRAGDTFEHDTLSGNERKDSFYSCRKEESFSQPPEPELGNIAKNSDPPNSRKNCQSIYSLSSELASSYYPHVEKESTASNSESDISIPESTSEYITWAKNCLFNWENKLYDSNQLRVSNDEVDQPSMKSGPEAGDKLNPDGKSHVTIQKNVSVVGDRCVEITSICLSQAVAKTSDESMSTAESKSVLSVIPEEKDGSVEKLKSPFLSNKNSVVTDISKNNSSNSILRPKLSVSPKFCSYSHDSLIDKKESLQSARSSKSRKSRKLQMVCSESEGEYSKFRDEMKHFCRVVPPQNPPRIIPSSSTFTPDKSVTHIE